MKRLLYLLSLLAVFFVAGCEEPIEEPVDEPDTYQPMEVSFGQQSESELVPGAEMTLPFHVSSSLPVTVEVKARGGIVAEVKGQGNHYELLIKAGESLEPLCEVDLIVFNDKETVVKTIQIKTSSGQDIPEEEVLQIKDLSHFSVGVEGGTVELVYISHVDCSVEFLDGSEAWLSVVPDSKGVETHTVTLNVKANEGEGRSGRVRLSTKSGRSSIEYTIDQAGVKDDENSLEVRVLSDTDLSLSAGLDIAVELIIKSETPVQTEIVVEGEGVTAELEDDYKPIYYLMISAGNEVPDEVKVTLIVSNERTTKTLVLDFKGENLYVEDTPSIHIDSREQIFGVTYLSNVDCNVTFEGGAESWLSVVPDTKAVEPHTIYIKAEQNAGEKRTGFVVITTSSGRSRIRYSVTQDIYVPEVLDWSAMPEDEIWYVSDNETEETLGLNSYISNIYSGGFGRLKFSGPLTSLSDLDVPDYITQLYLPDRIETMTNFQLIGTEISTLKLPADLKNLLASTIKNNPMLKNIVGALATEDGRAAVIDGKMIVFAPCGVTEYTVPSGVKEIGSNVFYDNRELKKLVLPEGVTGLGQMAVCECDIEEISLPSTLEFVDLYGLAQLPELKRISGASDWITPDGMAVLTDAYPHVGSKTLMVYASGSTNSTYSIPEGVTDLYPCAFYEVESLKEVYFPESLKELNGSSGFYKTYLEKITGPNVMEDNRSLVIDGQLAYVAPAGLREYVTPAGVKVLNQQVLADKPSLEKITLSDDVEEVAGYGYLLENNPNLKSVTLSARLRHLGYDPFGTNDNDYSNNIESIYIRSKYPPTVIYNNPLVMNPLAKATIYVQETQVDRYKSSSSWGKYASKIKPYDYGDMSRFDPEYYMSEDYSMDGTVVTLQEASKGKGIDIVLMGDAYSDREISDGSYREDMEFLYGHLFDEEPFKTFKDHFNVYYVNIVSDFEGYDYGLSALAGRFGTGTYVEGNNQAVLGYALKAISQDRMNDAMIVVLMNTVRYAGTCHMFASETQNDYGSGTSISYFPRGRTETEFAQTLHHEANGHGFAKLADEYFYEDYGRIPSNVIEQDMEWYLLYGWWKNVDYVSDPEQVRWAHFLADTRYAYDGLGVYEGASTYIYGAYRPTDNSIMRHNYGGFNAPSREAIYYRIHKLTYGDDWQYDYEKFVEYDAVNRKLASDPVVQMTRRQRNYVELVDEPSTPPVVYSYSWRDIK